MKPVVIILVFFILAQLLGLFAAKMLYADLTKNPYFSSFVTTSDVNDLANPVLFILYILIGAAVMMFFVHWLELHNSFVNLMEFMMIATSSFVVFYTILRLFEGYEFSTILAAVIAVFFAAIEEIKHSLKNVAAISISAGVGVLFGMSMGILPAILFLLLLSIYDFASVFASKHMVRLAKFVVQKDLALTITAKGSLHPHDEEERTIDLGTGDMIAPILFEVSTLAYNPVATIFVFAGAVISMTIFLFVVWRHKVILPALPPLVIGMLIMYALGAMTGFY